MSQFLDPNSQQMVAARFNAQHAANLVATTSHFADQFGVTDPSQFVTVVQQQQNTATQQFHNVANNFNFFQQPQNLAVVGTPVASSAPNMNMNSRRQAQGQSHMDGQLVTHQTIDQIGVNQHHLLDHNQQLTCSNPMNADNLSNHLANGSPFIFDQTNGVIRIPHTSVLDASNAIVVNTITSSLRQQQQHQHQLQQNQNYQQHSNSLSTAIDGSCQHNLISHHRGGGSGHANRVNRPSDENGHKRSDSGTLASLTPSMNGGGAGRSPNKSGGGQATNQTSRTGDSSKSKCSRSRNGAKKVQKPDKNSDPNRRTFACPTCGKGFTENFNMKRHMQIHSQSRPKFSCNECPKSFAWKDNFVRHKKAAHDNVIESFPLQ